VTTLADLSSLVELAFRDQERIAAAYVFGSSASGKTTPLSDIDVAIVIRDDCDRHQRANVVQETELTLMRSRPGETFDVHDLDDLPIAIAGRAVTEGKLVFERDPVARVRAEVAVRMAYYDSAWLEQATLEEGLDGHRKRLGDG
jgi:predicted nucleotidyltransferase